MSLFDPRMMDPSKLKPEMLMKLSQLVQELPPGMLSRMQTLMHNAMAGFDVRQEMEAFERELPPGFREKMARLMYEMHGVGPTNAGSVSDAGVVEIQKPLTSPKDARLTVLQAVASGELSAERALEVLFPEG